jgi:type I restriction enzyme, S subunit
MSIFPNKQMSEITTLVTDGKHGDCVNLEGSGYYFLSSKDLRDGRLHYDKPRQITYEGFIETHRRTNLKPGDILLANCGASIGRVGITQNDPRVYQTTFQKSVSVIKANKSLIDNKFLYYFLLCNNGVLVRLGGGAAQPNLLISDIKKISVPVPPRPIQHKIVGILSAYDDLIENNTRRIAILEAMAQAIYREWFVEFRFPGHEEVSLVNSELGKIPDRWKVCPFTDIADILNGGTPKTSVESYWSGELPFFTPKDCPEGFFVLSTERSITAEGLDSCASSLFPPRTVFITARGTVGKTVLNSVPMAMSQSCYAIVGKVNPQVFILMTLRRYIEELKKKSHGAVFDTIIKDTFVQLKVLCPDSPMVNAFCKAVNPVFDQILVVAKKQQVLRITRDLLLTKLISGQLDVEDLDIDTGEAVTE